MLVYGVAFGVLAHLWFWGAGLAMLCLPRRWRRFWPAVAFPCGMTLQSVVVWAGAYAGLKGTQSYAIPAELVPLVLAGIGWRKVKPSDRFGSLRFAARTLFVAGIPLAVLLLPLARAASGLTTAALGGCDAADYAAGARVLQEFARSDRSGFLGLTEVVHVASVNNFFDFWLRLNHFTPSALIAFNGTILHCAPYELTGLFACVCLAGTVPLVVWMARALLRLPRGAAAFAGLVYGFNPLTWYAVYQVAIGQLIAAAGIGLLTWAAIAAWRGTVPPPAAALAPARGSARRLQFTALLATAFALLLGAYNFILPVALTVAGGEVLLRAWTERRFRDVLPWLLPVGIAAAAAALVFWDRTAGLVERYRLFRTYDFGWHVPVLTPESWLGWVQGPSLEPWPGPLRAIILGTWLIIMAKAMHRRRMLTVFASLPVVAGYAYLVARGAILHTNASYDGYKLVCVFLPVLIPAALGWMRPARRARSLGWKVYPAAAVAAGTAVSCASFVGVMSAPPLIVDRDLIAVRRVENLPQVHSLNMRVPRMWERLWANALLLRRPQYFATHTYEGRRNTALRGEWDLNGGLAAVSLPAGDSIQIDPHYSLARVASPAYCRLALGHSGQDPDLVPPSGWYDEERLPRSSLTWRWTADEAWLTVVNPQAAPLRVRPVLEASALVPRRLELWCEGHLLGAADVTPALGSVALPSCVIAPGTHEWSIRCAPGAVRPSTGDTRRLGFSVRAIRLDVAAPSGSQ